MPAVAGGVWRTLFDMPDLIITRSGPGVTHISNWTYAARIVGGVGQHSGSYRWQWLDDEGPASA